MPPYLLANANLQHLKGPGNGQVHIPSQWATSEGYHPPSRIGEQPLNAFVDERVFTELGKPKDGKEPMPMPMFHEWATVLPGMICVGKQHTSSAGSSAHRVMNYGLASETSIPVIACASNLAETDEKDYFFAGISRSKVVRQPDDGIGPSVDEYFTVAIRGLATILNTTNNTIFAGQELRWTFKDNATANNDWQRLSTSWGPRHVGIKIVGETPEDRKFLIGRAVSTGWKGQPIDILIKD